MNTLAIAMGGHCRVGLEDNIYLNFDRSVLATNLALVERVVQISETFGRPLASSASARTMLGLERRPPVDIPAPREVSDAGKATVG
jgi:3-keto-5-aminohexanoate cleavage enzyme